MTWWQHYDSWLALGGMAGLAFWCAYPGESYSGTIVRGMAAGLMVGAMSKLVKLLYDCWRGRKVPEKSS